MATPRATSRSMRRKQLIDFARRERRRRLVHDEDRTAWSFSALAISTICRWARLSRTSGSVGIDRHPEIGEQLAGVVCSSACQSMTPGARVGAAPRKMFSATDRCGTRLSSW